MSLVRFMSEEGWIWIDPAIVGAIHSCGGKHAGIAACIVHRTTGFIWVVLGASDDIVQKLGLNQPAAPSEVQP